MGYTEKFKETRLYQKLFEAKEITEDLLYGIKEEILDINKMRKGRIAPIWNWGAGWTTVTEFFYRLSMGDLLGAGNTLAVSVPNVMLGHASDNPRDIESGIDSKGIFWNLLLTAGMVAATRYLHVSPSISYNLSPLIYGIGAGANIIESIFRYKGRSIKPTNTHSITPHNQNLRYQSLPTLTRLHIY